ncbi:Hypothetical protein HEAR2303 [Herminiimonas arsenicoxydans]|uniref:Uncharacterized protein n=1 Tax=Herminiimonas arsenicoxydans TaxID=204773 RepID=A4G7E7_HERAR|nr:Hypothetical protein HEAR2303 [Herminiimonas arsenicoxydans]
MIGAALGLAEGFFTPDRQTNMNLL